MSKAKSQMDSKVGSSGSSSSTSSSMDLKLKTSEKESGGNSKPSGGGGGGNISRSRRFFFCLGSHIGRQRQQSPQQEQRDKQHQYKKKQRCKNLLAIYNSEDDIHSSSTDSCSLSYEHSPSCLMTGSSIDITGEERSSGASSSASAYSRYSSAVFASESDDMWSKQQHPRRQFYVETMYRRPMTAQGQSSTDEYSSNSSSSNSSSNSSNNPDDNDNDNDDDHHDGKACPIDNRITKEQKNNNNRNTKSKHGQQENNQRDKLSQSNPKSKSNSNSNSSSKRSNSDTPPRSQSVSPCSIAKGLHLSRLSIASSVCRMFHQLTATSMSSTTSTRSLSCSSTPFKEATGSRSSRSRNCNSSSKKPPATGSTTTSSGSASSKKKERKQQSILRPPVHYVYMKGMSGLYSRVPRYTTCCPYTTHQAA